MQSVWANYLLFWLEFFIFTRNIVRFDIQWGRFVWGWRGWQNERKSQLIYSFIFEIAFLGFVLFHIQQTCTHTKWIIASAENPRALWKLSRDTLAPCIVWQTRCSSPLIRILFVCFFLLLLLLLMLCSSCVVILHLSYHWLCVHAATLPVSTLTPAL